MKPKIVSACRSISLILGSSLVNVGAVPISNADVDVVAGDVSVIRVVEALAHSASGDVIDDVQDTKSLALVVALQVVVIDLHIAVVVFPRRHGAGAFHDGHGDRIVLAATDTQLVSGEGGSDGLSLRFDFFCCDVGHLGSPVSVGGVPPSIM